MICGFERKVWARNKKRSFANAIVYDVVGDPPKACRPWYEARRKSLVTQPARLNPSGPRAQPLFYRSATIWRDARFRGVAGPIEITIRHSLGRDEARRRIDRGIGQLGGFIPGSRISGHSWRGDTMTVAIEAMGQRVAAQFEVLEDRVQATLDLPPLLSLLAGKFRAALGDAGMKLLR